MAVMRQLRCLWDADYHKGNLRQLRCLWVHEIIYFWIMVVNSILIFVYLNFILYSFLYFQLFNFQLFTLHFSLKKYRSSCNKGYEQRTFGPYIDRANPSPEHCFENPVTATCAYPGHAIVELTTNGPRSSIILRMN